MSASAASESVTPARPAGVARAKTLVMSDRADRVGLVVALGALIVFLTTQSEYFLTWSNFEAIALAMSFTAVMAAAQTIVLVSGGLDLSFTAVFALAGVAAHTVLDAGAPLPVVLLAGFGVGLGVGLINAVLIVGVGVNPLIATLGTAFMFRGVALIWTDGQSGGYFRGTAFNALGSGTIVGIPVPVVIMIAVFAAVGFAMRFSRFGARVQAVGGSEQATRLAGISVPRLRTSVYVISGLCSALAGMMLVAFNGSAFPQAATGEELIVLSAVILGGTALTGGRGTVTGTILGVALLATLANGLNLLGVTEFWQTFLQGTILVLAVTADALRRRARARVGVEASA